MKVQILAPRTLSALQWKETEQNGNDKYAQEAGEGLFARTDSDKGEMTLI